MKSTKFWIVIIAALLVISGLAAFFIIKKSPEGGVAKVYLEGECIEEIPLGTLTEEFEITVKGDSYENTITARAGKICVSSATCPDKVCVNQGWIATGAVPIVCLPNKLVIQIEGGDDLIDGVSR